MEGPSFGFFKYEQTMVIKIRPSIEIEEKKAKY
jgi:hypothetical protein